MSNPLQGHPDGENLRAKAGEYIKKLRTAQEMTQQELATKVGMPYYTMISQIEAGKARVPPDRVLAFAKALGVEPKQFATRLLSYYDPEMWKIIFGNGSST